MSFNSISFLIFFPVVVLLYYVVPGRFRTVLLLVASYFFYMSWNVKYAVLIAISTLSTWMIGLVLEKQRAGGVSFISKRAAVVLCLGINFGILFVFKYLDFAISVLNRVFRMTGMAVIDRTSPLLLPVGISFYTFQAIGYIIDVYRGDVTAEKNLLKYALFVSFFPQLVAGPIERSGRLLKQIREIPGRIKPEWDRITNGLVYMLYGFFLKLVIADRAAILVNTVWESWNSFGGVELLAASLGFSIQIYCDFASYSIIAIGAAQVMGFELMENFRAPYFAKSIREFWHRWHISLSTWFRDYLYIPLGGGKHGAAKKYANTFITFILSGLWHGAGMSFVLWGAVHGLLQIVDEITAPVRKKILPYTGIRNGTAFHRLLKTTVTFFLVNFAWILFRAPNSRSAVGFFKNIFLLWNPWAIWDGSLYKIGLSHYELNVLAAGVLFLILVDAVQTLKKRRIDTIVAGQGTLCKGCTIIFMVYMIYVFGIYGEGYNATDFIYFQF